MKKKLVYFICICFIQLTFGQVVISELDCDTPGVDDMEFLELLSDTPNFPLDGFVVVFFNGSNSGMNSSYFTLDLDGYETDINGLLLIGSNSVSPVPQVLIAQNTFQNGADAVAIYEGDAIDFPEQTLATIDNLVDVLLYDTGESDDDLIAIFNQDPRFTAIQQINEGPNNNTNSIQRFVDIDDNVTYTSTTPTPRQRNDGSGVVLNGITIGVAQSQYNEDESFEVTFTLETPPIEDLNFNIRLDNFGFNTSDFNGNTALTIPVGQTTASTTLTLVDDTDDEGDEVTRLRFENLPIEYLALNNNLQIRIVDNDFTMANFGTPINPTFGKVNSTQPSGYYNTLNELADAALRQALQDIIAEEGVVRAQTYADVNVILAEADENPLNSNQVWLVYTAQGRAKLDAQNDSNNLEKWNREHTYPRSRGGFYGIEEDEIADGRDLFWNTTADSLRHGYSDAHALRAADGPENSSRNNKHYGDVNSGGYEGPINTAGSFYGDVARSVLYMEIRYNGLEVVNGFPENASGVLGDLATLLDWHRNDPPDDFEMNRNNVVYDWQFNRNPFIDQPDLVEYIWGDNVGDSWIQPLSITENSELNVTIYPNPADDRIYITGLNSEALIEIFSMEGKRLKTYKFVTDSVALDLPSGLYMLKLTSENRSVVKKIVIN